MYQGSHTSSFSYLQLQLIELLGHSIVLVGIILVMDDLWRDGIGSLKSVTHLGTVLLPSRDQQILLLHST